MEKSLFCSLQLYSEIRDITGKRGKERTVSESVPASEFTCQQNWKEKRRKNRSMNGAQESMNTAMGRLVLFCCPMMRMTMMMTRTTTTTAVAVAIVPLPVSHPRALLSFSLSLCSQSKFNYAHSARACFYVFGLLRSFSSWQQPYCVCGTGFLHSSLSVSVHCLISPTRC